MERMALSDDPLDDLKVPVPDDVPELENILEV